MTSEDQSLTRRATVVNELGLHARSAAKLAKLAQQAAGPVWLVKDDDRVDAKQVIDILSLAAAQGDTLRVIIASSSDMSVLEQIVTLFNRGFEEQV